MVPITLSTNDLFGTGKGTCISSQVPTEVVYLFRELGLVLGLGFRAGPKFRATVWVNFGLG